MLLGTFGFFYFENLSLIDAFYFCIVTIATVGYGDIHPATQAGKILAILIIISGVGTFLGVVANATEILLNRREETARHQKLNMVAGLFFSELGNELLKYVIELDSQLSSKQKDLCISNQWTKSDFKEIQKKVRTYKYNIDIQRGDLSTIAAFLKDKTDFLLRLIENPVLLEHEHFTELLRTIFHLRDEFLNRSSFTDLPETDYQHLAGDFKRVYTLLVREWLLYMEHLKENYPYLFSLATRTNPFDPSASPVVQ
jgi:hypothetical protein